MDDDYYIFAIHRLNKLMKQIWLGTGGESLKNMLVKKTIAYQMDKIFLKPIRKNLGYISSF